MAPTTTSESLAPRRVEVRVPIPPGPTLTNVFGEEFTPGEVVWTAVRYPEGHVIIDAAAHGSDLRSQVIWTSYENPPLPAWASTMPAWLAAVVQQMSAVGAEATA